MSELKRGELQRANDLVRLLSVVEKYHGSTTIIGKDVSFLLKLCREEIERNCIKDEPTKKGADHE